MNGCKRPIFTRCLGLLIPARQPANPPRVTLQPTAPPSRAVVANAAVIWAVSAFVGICCVTISAPGCASAPPASRGSLISDNPGEVLYAVRRAGAADNASPRTIRQLVELLEHDDPAVRMMTINALERLTGRTDRYGYDPYADPATRGPAVARWVAAARAMDFEGDWSPSDSPVAVHDRESSPSPDE